MIELSLPTLWGWQPDFNSKETLQHLGIGVLNEIRNLGLI
jgi:hypothetical protein